MASNVKKNHVELGFLEDGDPELLLSHQFPSKVGGKPAWLSLSQIPNPNELTCCKCGQVSLMLMQVYSPLNDNPTSFHRTIYIFICKNPACTEINSNENFIVLRSQLPRINKFYSPEPPKHSSSGPTAEDFHKLCCVCGISGPKVCSKCHNRSYCSKEHQVLDWKHAHKKQCGNGNVTAINTENRDIGWLFQESELVTETEEFQENEVEKSEDEKMKDLQEFLKSESSKSLLDEAHPDDLEKMANKGEDRMFVKFKQRIQKEPEQVLRYDRGGIPLWVSNNHIPKDGDIPKCSCGSTRQFEFQVMPQILNYLNVDKLDKSIDWGTLCVYTCTANCDISDNYHKEFLWKQDYSS